MKRTHLTLVKHSKVNEDKRSRKLAIIKRKSEKLILNANFQQLPIDHAKFIKLYHGVETAIWTDEEIEVYIRGLDMVLNAMGKIKPRQVTGLQGR